MKKSLLIAAFVFLCAMLPTEVPAMSDGCLCWQFEEAVRLLPGEIWIDMICLDLWLGGAGASVSGFAQIEGGARLPVDGTATFDGDVVTMGLSLARYSVNLDLDSAGAGQAVFYDPSYCWVTIDPSPSGGGTTWKCGSAIAWGTVSLNGVCPGGP